MKKKNIIIISAAMLVIAAAAAVLFIQPSKWSQKTFEAIVQETITRPDGALCLIVDRTTERYSDSLNSLHISEDTELIGLDGKKISFSEILPGCKVEVTLKDAFTEEVPFYYPVVYKIKVKES